MVRAGLVAAAAVAAGVVGIGAAAAPEAEPPPGARISASLEYVTRVPGTSQVVEGKFDKVRGRQILVITGRFGFKTLDVSDPTSPVVLDTFQPEMILGPSGYWQDEDMDIDTRRKLIIGALDPRHDNVDQASCPGIGAGAAKTRNPLCRSGFYVISYRDPENLRQIGDFVDLPAGHTVSCIDDCRYVWTGGPARRSDQTALGPFTPGGRGDGRPIWVTDLRDPENPVTFPDPIDLWRNDGFTDYSHDVDVDDKGIAWTSGRGGLLGYATKGVHRDPRTNTRRKARPWDPILVAGGGVEGGPDGVAQPQTDFIHNAARPLGGKIRAAGVPNGNVVIMTEEDFTGPCSQSGRIVAADITDSLGGEPAASSTPAAPYRMNALSAFHPTQDAADTTSPSGGCSAHYFEIAGSTVAAAWYGQGLRLIDASDARNLRQVGYFYVAGTDPATNPSSNSWDVAWRGDLVYLFDMNRGVEILRLAGGPSASARLPTVREPARGPDPLAPRPVPGSGLTPGSLVCPLFETPGRE
jgi:hypothetical protein